MRALAGRGWLGRGLGLDFLKRPFNQLPLFLADAPLEGSKIQKRGDHRQAGKSDADQPIGNELKLTKAAPEHRFAAQQHSQSAQQRQSAKPAPSRSAIDSHAVKLTQKRSEPQK